APCNTARRASFASKQILQPKRDRVSGHAGASPDSNCSRSSSEITTSILLRAMITSTQFRLIIEQHNSM
ncbi:hypothetical protein, partial [Burkholderia ubonensis]|uniref:hypothetical protein n=1 Tax=Burkholderia ubonensis TaxID=101571 RepID=UPI001E590DEF